MANAAKSSKPDIDLLLIGKTGGGKSATGNSIIQQKVFKSGGSTMSLTTKCSHQIVRFEDKIIKVVDGPGLIDNRGDAQAAVKLVVDALDAIFKSNPRGYHAFLLVIKYGGRFNTEEISTVSMLKKIFGESFVAKFCVLVMTCGDDFEQDGNESFEEWCCQQSGEFVNLLQECKGRIVLFDNRTTDDIKRHKQIKKLLDIVSSLGGVRYSDANFELSASLRKGLPVEAKKKVVEESIMEEMSLTLQDFQDITSSDENYLKKIIKLGKLEAQVEKLSQEVEKEDCNTNVLHQLKESVNRTKNLVKNEVEVCRRMSEKVKQTGDQAGSREILNLEMAKHKLEMLALLNSLFQKQHAIQEENDRGLFQSLGDVVSWPFRTVHNLFND